MVFICKWGIGCKRKSRTDDGPVYPIVGGSLLNPRHKFALLLTLLFVGVAFLATQRFAAELPQQRFTGYPPSIYMKSFVACADAPCTRTDDFRVDPIPEGCCILQLTSGDGRGADEVRSYEVFLNAEKIISAGNARDAQAPIKVLPTNTLKVVLTGQPPAKVFILIAYDPRKSK